MMNTTSWAPPSIRSGPPTRPGARPPIALVINGSDETLDACHRSVRALGGIALECDIESAWLAAFAWSPFAIIASAAVFDAEGKGLRSIADGSGARLVRIEDEPLDEGLLEAALNLALIRFAEVHPARAAQSLAFLGGAPIGRIDRA